MANAVCQGLMETKQAELELTVDCSFRGCQAEPSGGKYQYAVFGLFFGYSVAAGTLVSLHAVPIVTLNWVAAW